MWFYAHSIRCLGTTQHLKSRFGNGYSLEVKMAAAATAQETAQRMQALQRYIKETFPSAVQTECFAERAIYKIPADNVTSLAQAFAALENGECNVLLKCMQSSVLAKLSMFILATIIPRDHFRLVQYCKQLSFHILEDVKSWQGKITRHFRGKYISNGYRFGSNVLMCGNKSNSLGLDDAISMNFTSSCLWF